MLKFYPPITDIPKSQIIKYSTSVKARLVNFRGIEQCVWRSHISKIEKYVHFCTRSKTIDMTNTFTKLWGSAMLLCLACTVQAQIILTGVFEGPLSPNNGSRNVYPRGIEVFLSSDIDFSTEVYKIRINGNSSPFVIPTSLGSQAEGTFLYFTNDADYFIEFFGFPADVVASNFVTVNGSTTCTVEILDNNNVEIKRVNRIRFI